MAAAKAAESEENKLKKVVNLAAVQQHFGEEPQEGQQEVEIDPITGDVLAVKRVIQCYRCNGFGHMQNDCPTANHFHRGKPRGRGQWRGQRGQRGRGGRGRGRGRQVNQVDKKEDNEKTEETPAGEAPEWDSEEQGNE